MSTVIEKQNKENIPSSRLQQIFIRTEMWNENSIYTSMEEYRNINIPHGEYFNKKAKESHIVSDITKILSRYNLKIGSLSYEGLLPLDGKVIKEINKNIELNTSESLPYREISFRYCKPIVMKIKNLEEALICFKENAIIHGNVRKMVTTNVVTKATKI